MQTDHQRMIFLGPSQKRRPYERWPVEMKPVFGKL